MSGSSPAAARLTPRPGVLAGAGLILLILVALVSSCSGASGIAGPVPTTGGASTSAPTIAPSVVQSSAAGQAVPPQQTAAYPILDGDAPGNKLIDNMNLHDTFAFADLIGTFTVVTLEAGSVDNAHNHPTSGYEFRSLWGKWKSPDVTSAPTSPEPPSGMTWAITRDGAVLDSGVLLKTGPGNGSFVSATDVSSTVSVQSPPVTGNGKGATLFTLVANKNILWTLSMDTGKILSS